MLTLNLMLVYGPAAHVVFNFSYLVPSCKEGCILLSILILTL